MQLGKLGSSTFFSTVKKDLETIVNTLAAEYIEPAMTALYAKYTETLPDFVDWLRTRLKGWTLGRGTLPHGWPIVDIGHVIFRLRVSFVALLPTLCVH